MLFLGCSLCFPKDGNLEFDRFLHIIEQQNEKHYALIDIGWNGIDDLVKQKHNALLGKGVMPIWFDPENGLGFGIVDAIIEHLYERVKCHV